MMPVAAIRTKMPVLEPRGVLAARPIFLEAIVITVYQVNWRQPNGIDLQAFTLKTKELSHAGKWC
jgi:hypothetical protein